MLKKLKYVIINVIAIGIFLLGLLLVDLSVGSDDRSINSLQTVIAGATIASPFVFYLIMAVIDANSNNKITKFGRHSRNTFFAIAAIIVAVGIITAIAWFANGTTGSASSAWISWSYDYRGVLFATVFLAVIASMIGLAVNLYVWLISTILLKIKERSVKEVPKTRSSKK